MKTSTLITGLLLSLSTISFAQVPEKLLIEDFETANTQNSLGGYWYTFNDNQGGGKSRLQQQSWQQGLDVTGGYESLGMLNVDVVLEKANYQWGPYYAFATGINKSSKVNPKDFMGMSYWHKGVAHTVRVDIPEVKDYDYHSIRIPAHDAWTLVKVDFSMMSQGGWGKKVDLNLDNSLKLVWNLDVTSGNFQMDNISFVKEIKYEKQNNMEILPAEVPEGVEVKGNVQSALNDLSKKYLTKGMNFASWGEANKITSANPNNWKYNEETIKLQAQQGLKGIRLPIDLDLYVVDRLNVLNGSKKEIQIEPLLWTVLDSMNVWTKRHGLSLTVDYHAYDGTYNRANSKNPLFKTALANIWKVVAEHFVDEKREDLFFELTNEPGLSLPDGEFIDQADWRSLAQEMITAIRQVDKTRPIIFGDVKWYSLDELIKNEPFEDKNIIYCFHMYDPFVFTHQGASWTNMGSMKNIPFPYSPERWTTEFREIGVDQGTPQWVKDQLKRYYKEGNKQHIKNRLAKVKNWAFDHQVPLICNEWGALANNAKIEDLNAYFKTMGEIFQEMDISWQVWFGIMDNENKLLPGMAEALGLDKK